jgi:hypothetical protein
MNKQTLGALRGSIQKWKRIVVGTGIDNGTHNCPLCTLFYADDCIGCPVAKKTGLSCCMATPYEAYEKIVPLGKKSKSIGATAAAKKELQFLQSLLPKKKTRKAP